MTTIENIPSTGAVAPVPYGRITDPAACPGQRQSLARQTQQARAPWGPLAASAENAAPVGRSARSESGPR